MEGKTIDALSLSLNGDTASTTFEQGLQ